MSTSGGPARYQIRVEGVLDSRWATWFGGLQVERDDTQTVISGPLVDQPALHGLLTKIRDLGLCLISVRRLDPDEPETGKVRRLWPRRSGRRSTRSPTGWPASPDLDLAAWARELADLFGHAASSGPPASDRRVTT